MSNCGVCGEPMPPGEEMFKYHGYSGPCPKPPLPIPEKPTAMERAAKLAEDWRREFPIVGMTDVAMGELIRRIAAHITTSADKT